MNNILSVRTYNILNIFFLHLVSKTAGIFTNIVFFLVTEISSKNVLPVCKINAELSRLAEATFDSKVALLRKIKKKNLIIPKSLQKKVRHFFLFVSRC